MVKCNMKKEILKKHKVLFNGREKVLNTFKKYGFPMKAMHNNASENLTSSKIPIQKQAQGTRIKILTPKKIVQRLPIARAQVKPGNTSEDLLNRI